jgi:RNA polymerase sigma-70 factor (ECF subfamily)
MTRRVPADREAFENLYHATRTDLLGYFARRCGNPEEAADLLAETYLIAWQKLSAIPEGDRARLWLFGVARNLLLRGARRRRVADALIARLSAGLESAQAGTPVDDCACDALRSGLTQLSDRDREILTLAAWEDLTPAEIAAVIGISANAVRIRLHRTRIRLAEQLNSLQPTTATGAVAIGPHT